jgi:hypothetical protein
MALFEKPVREPEPLPIAYLREIGVNCGVAS